MERGHRKVRVGRVVSDRMDKTVVVEVERLTAHPLYGRRIRRTKRYMAHNEGNQAKLGDLVRIMETRPLSRRKRWRVVEVLEHSEARALAERERVAGEAQAEL
ncbi:MAG: 30S ribosomal protein S17 [Thermaerobacter sp.]|nr:30S ribosomal protein S17 [Bacillota bacterium]REJ38365.1 MAG: 30S ribosomal protein S17 [Bacillota bacterium]